MSQLSGQTGVPSATRSADIVIAGGGAAGCVLAHRLSADPTRRVILLEAGLGSRKPLHSFAFLTGHYSRQPQDNWYFHTQPQPELGDRKILWPRGKRLGGSSIFNGMVYARGNAGDYDHWAQLGNIGWSYADVLPYFKRNERHVNGESELHGGAGLLCVTPAKVSNPLFDAFIKAGAEAGHRVVSDMNGPDATGVGYYDFNMEKGRRSNSARALLESAGQRPNLEIIDRAQVTRIIVQGGVAVGVEYERGGQLQRVDASKEVILSAGAVGSPHILLLSGIGPVEQLRAKGIAPILDLPGVGENLIDHIDAFVRSAARQNVSLLRELRVDRIVSSVARGVLFGTGPVTESPISAGGYFRSREGLEYPDLQAFFLPIAETGAKVWYPFTSHARHVAASHAYSIRIGPIRPESRGRITLDTPDPHAAPLIDPAYLTSEADLSAIVAGLRIARNILEQPAFAPFRKAETAPGSDVQDYDGLAAYARRTAGTVFHPVGTAKMGTDPMAVVDARLRVRGIANLRVADASIMPTISSGNTNAPTMMIAEKAADMVIQDGRA